MSIDMAGLSEDDLLELIGKDITANERGALGLSTKQLIERANRWLKANLEDLKTRICGNATVRVCLESGDNTALIGAVSSLIENVCVGTSASPVAILLCRRGIGHLCETEWKKPAQQ